jgi:hypothetical protein
MLENTPHAGAEVTQGRSYFLIVDEVEVEEERETRIYKHIIKDQKMM